MLANRLRMLANRLRMLANRLRMACSSGQQHAYQPSGIRGGFFGGDKSVSV
jgi:hypothetical protein